MAIVAVFQGPSFTRQNYEESVRRVTGGKARVEIGIEGEPEVYEAHTFVSA